MLLVGASDLLVEGTFEWVDESAWGYENWAPEEPNDMDNEDCALITPTGDWNDQQCTGALVFACKAPHV